MISCGICLCLTRLTMIISRSIQVAARLFFFMTKLYIQTHTHTYIYRYVFNETNPDYLVETSR